ncbi:DUF7573 domain-containing protein [Halorubellus litoreus]|uniref:GATA-type domain-containing protein n=1 Tax=Halorubellus litoreus TaxID=755308 RepID=A0ABD5VD51_9EURY
MTEDASIDEFVGRDAGDGTDDEECGDDAQGADELSDDGSGPSDATESTVAARVASASPAVSTSRYEPAGAACAVCDAVVERLWVADDDGGDVCAACKPW